MLLKNKLFSSLFIDIREESVRVVQGRPLDNNLNFVVDSFGSLFLPGHLQQEDIEQLAANADRLKQFLKDKKMKAARVVAGLGQNGVITRNVKVPKMSMKDLDSMMKLNIKDFLPVSTEEYSFDYKVLQEVEEDGHDKLELLVAAVNRKQVEQCALLLEKAGLKPLVFDILPNMLHRLLGHLVYRDTLVVDSGSEGTHIAIFKGKELFIYVDIPFVFSAEGENDFSVLAREMSGYLDYFSSRNYGKTVDGITVVGEMAACFGVAEILEKFVVFPVTVGLSLAGPLGFKGKAADFAEQAAVYAGNLGLMMRDSFLPSKAAPVTPGIPASSRETFGT